MAKRRRIHERREPVFDVAPESDSSPKAQKSEDEEAPRRAKPAGSGRSSRKRSRRGRGGGRITVGRMFYWGAVAGLWLFIAALGLVAFVGARLPPIQSLEVPKRPPSIQIVDRHGRTFATRGDMGGAAIPLNQLPRHVP